MFCHFGINHQDNHTNDTQSKPQKLSEISADAEERWALDMVEFARVLGGGIVPGSIVLLGGDPGIGELQKRDLLLEARGSGQGARVLAAILQAARAAGYKKCYLETLERMSEARRLYEKHGFEYIDSSLGDTGHSGCNWWMIKAL